MSVLFEEFLCFFQYRTYDVLSNGLYKKKLTQCKEKGDFWAIDMHNKQNKIHQYIKQIQVRIGNMGKSSLGVACKNVINCAQPPVKIFLGFSTCFVTGLQSDKCLDISKNGKKSHDMHIHPKFAFFFLFLWYICKLEYVIRACAKHWMDSKNLRKGDSKDETLEEYMKENEGLCRSLFEVFQKAMDYVNASLELYEEEFMVKPILDPEPSYWEKHKRLCTGIKTEV